MNLNDFKQVNDTLGHDQGDTLLRELGKRLTAALRETDTVARLEHGRTTADLLRRADLVVYYQPEIDLATGKTTGVEALVRWRHLKQGLLHPASFLPHIERTTLMVPLTRWVLNEALRQQRIWRDEGVDLTLAVNISARALQPRPDGRRRGR